MSNELHSIFTYYWRGFIIKKLTQINRGFVIIIYKKGKNHYTERVLNDGND